MFRFKVSAWPLLIPVWICGISCVASDPAVRPSVTSQIEGVDRLGVDAAGHLWTWSEDASEAKIYLETETLTLPGLPQFTDLDVDHRHGVVFLLPEARELESWNWLGERTHVLELPFQARGIAWLTSDTVLVAPSDGDFVLAKVNLEGGSVEQKMGSVPELSPGPGVVFLRTTKIEPDLERGVVHTLESFQGDYWMFDLDSGEVIEHHLIENPDQQRIEQGFAQTHLEALQAGRTQRLGIEWFRLGLDAAHQPWTIRQCINAEDDPIVDLVRLNSNYESHQLSVRCCSPRMAVFENRLLIVGSINNDPCTTQEELPK